ncbi:hypothetical protein AB3662_24240 [Sorangium cellulosum]|uniref:hypothetical protein n=1 Tax=Sorangium cellulosum TaxID=56 RepID=UPI003D9A8B74
MLFDRLPIAQRRPKIDASPRVNAKVVPDSHPGAFSSRREHITTDARGSSYHRALHRGTRALVRERSRTNSVLAR